MKRYKILLFILGFLILQSTTLAIKNPFLTKNQQPYIVDKIPELTKQALELKKGEPDPIWQNQLKEYDLDELLVIPGKGVLVGLTKISWFGVYSLAYGPYILFDPDTGAEKWSFNRNGVLGSNDAYSIISCDPVLLIRWDNSKGSEYIALDPGSGKKIWSKTFSANHCLAIDHRQQLLVVAEGPNFDPKKDRSELILKLSNLDMLTGKIKWETKEENLKTDSELPRLEIGTQNIVLIGSSVISRSLSNGKIQWSVAGAGPIASSSLAIYLTSGDIFLPTPNNTLLRINKDGKKFGKLNSMVKSG
jgi:outer membrane protein assembly factor BamB